MNPKYPLAIVMVAALLGACGTETNAPDSTSDQLIDRIAAGDTVLEVRGLGPDSTDQLPIYELVYSDGSGTRTATVSPPYDDSPDNAAAVALITEMAPEFRDLVLESTAAGSIGDFLKKVAWLACVKWCLLIDDDPAALCAASCCADPQLVEICLPQP